MIQFLKNYINLERVETKIIIRLHIVQTWLYKLGYIYKNLRKHIFMDGYKQLDILENCAKILRKIEKFKLYIVEFNQDRVMKSKIYASDCIVEGENH